MARIICVVNPVKGVGRTSTAVNFAASLSLLEKKTLIVDCDPFNQASEYLGLPVEKYDYGLDDLLTGFLGGKGVVVNSELEYLDIIPAGHDLDSIEKNLAYNPDKEKVLSIIIKKFRADYDYIIFDTPSSYGLLTKSALLASDELFLTLKKDTKVVENMNTILKIVNEISKEYKSVIQICGVFFTFCKNIKAIKGFSIEDINEELKDVVFQASLPESLFIEEVVKKKKPACLIDLKSDIAEAFLALAYEFLERQS